MCSYMGSGGEIGHYSDLGERYFNEFNTHFWLRPGNDASIINMSNLYYEVWYLSLFIFLIFLDSSIQRVCRTNSEKGARRGRRNQ